MEQIELQVTSREILGKKVRFLRRQGVIPVHLYGSGIESMALQCDTTELRRALDEAGKTQLISLKIDNEKKPRTVVVHEVHVEPQTGEALHVDFYQVKMTEKVRVEIPVVLVGEAPALKLKENMLVQELNALSVECLPAKIPPSIELDLNSLTESEQAMRVKDIELDREITVLNDPELVMVKVSVRRVEKVEEPVIAEGEEAEVSEETPVGEEKSKEE